MTTWSEFKKELLANPDIRNEYDALGDEFEVIGQLLRARRDAQLTQQQLADKSGLKQSYIARIESGKANPTLGTLLKLSQAMEKKLVIQIR